MNCESHNGHSANHALRELVDNNRSSLHIKEDKFSLYPMMVGPNISLELIASGEGVLVHLNIKSGKSSLLLTFLDFNANNTVDHINYSINGCSFDCFLDKAKARNNGAMVDQLIPAPNMVERKKDTSEQREQLLSICNHAISLALDILGDVIEKDLPDFTLKDFGYVNFVRH